MKIERIKTFITLVDLESYSLTAEKFEISQPAVSMQIKSLEKYFDTELFYKEKGQIILSPAGKIVYQEGKKIVKRWGYLKQKVESKKNMQTKQLKIASSTIPSAYLLPEILSILNKNIDDLKTEVSVGDSRSMINLLENNEVDLIIVGYKPKNNKFKSIELCSDNLSLIVPLNHPLAGKEKVFLAELQNHSILMREEGSGTRKATIVAFKEAAFKLEDFNIISELGSTEAVISAVESGLGISFISKIAAKKAAACRRIVEIKVADAEYERNFYLAYNKNRHDDYLINTFIEAAKNIL
ncbi:DNA-binding transcriptional regulator, LysR family [Halanaerobium congolense]|jgi:DNA-binding transcriptional LysR family regulator|uniref:DNA-binding transcriptional regulator, LysR family n=1 Tax=Halanaerobium congolense TaxID=54121 RepID=A0A1G8JXB6_9FIRM|nr:selenium metabolism-associated LysR family transcriptional regulator [Halanaerobium congolense]PUU89206.1 MAG: LysR family transcriptional regulator [Halanaerobium sp.]TDP26746.1 LysR family transcriptional regulator [Halanaerobium congolense]TDX42295.1 LysR family transcriptional regulator [Halanaerobium congolense]SDI35809.1 DNA-binding transcriptional regulator, LysR family [Halanaerobium congolense]SET01283.1 DNA-binding transcriptional regulator, LysR family [Halanaerobium congolense]